MNVAAIVLGAVLSLLAFMPAAQVSSAATPHLQRGIELIEANQPLEAIAELDQAVALDPVSPRIRYNLGRALFAVGRYEDALEHLTVGLPRAADRSAFGLVMGQSLIELGRLPEAQTVLDGADALRPGFAPIRLQLARVCYRVGKVDTALQKLTEVAALAPEWTVPRLQAASIAAESGDAATAAAMYQAALDINPAQPLIWIRLGDSLEANLDFVGATKAYRSAVERAPELPQARLALAYFFFNRQQFDDAATVLSELLQKLPDDPQVLLPVAEIQMLEGKHEEALQNIESALRGLGVAPGATASQQATTDSQRGDGSAGSPGILRRRALELRAKTLTSLSRLVEAEAAARALLAENPSNLDGLFSLGTVLLRSGNQEGRDYLTTFQRLSDAREHRELAYDYYVRGKDPERAAAEFERALTIDPEDAAALTGLGAVRLAQGDAQAAVDLLSRAQAEGALSLEWYREWVLALHAVGRTEEARAMWQQARDAGVSLGPRVWAALGQHQGAC